MSEEMLVKHCAPTLAGIKTGSMFSCRCQSDERMRGVLRRWNEMLTGKGLRALPLRYHKGRALIYVYRPSQLSCDLRNQTACRLLCQFGYGLETPERCIAQLMRRLREHDSFPHEVGLFLGYPPEDVMGFIENKAGGCKCAGCWKVYGDEEAARKTFARYKKCTDIYCAQYAKGKSVDRLTVAG